MRVLFVLILLLGAAQVAHGQVPSNASPSPYGKDGWKCNRGFYRSNGRCLVVAVPANASLNYYGDGWKCNRGFYRSNGRCLVVAVPANASLNYYGDDWKCNSGFVRRSASCVSLGSATDSEIRKYLIMRSISGYSGSCPCPWNSDRAGRSCGGRSAYSRAGGASPRCYDQDIPQSEVIELRRRFAKP
jgi:hypothetical protein